MTHVKVDFFKKGGKWYTDDKFDTETECFETQDIIEDIKNPLKCKQAHLTESMNFIFEAYENGAVNKRLILLIFSTEEIEKIMR